MTCGIDNTFVVINYFFYDGKPYACASVFLFAVELLKYFKYFSGEFFFKTNTVVGDADVKIFFIGWQFCTVDFIIIYNMGPDCYAGWYTGLRKFERITNEVIHELTKLEGDNFSFANFFYNYDCMLFLNDFFELFFYFFYNDIQICFFKFSFCSAEP